MSTQTRVARLRMTAGIVLVAGLIAAFLVGATLKAQVSAVPGNLTVKSISYVDSPKGGGEGAFNWLFALLVAGPTVVAAATIYAASEMVGQLRRGGGRSRSSSSLGVGDEV
jgi:hypothetical protein